MNKIYLLLRNNKQSGPYALNELLTLTLKPSDLIWMEGKSAAWQNPVDIDTLKPFVSGSEPVQEPLAPVVKASAEVKQASPISTEARIAEKEIKVAKQSFATPEKHIFISLPFNTEPPLLPVTEESFTERMSTMQQTAASFFTEAEEPGNETEADTNDTGFQNKINQDYSGRLQKQNRQSRFITRNNLLACILTLIITGWVIIILKWSHTNKYVTQQTDVTSKTIQERTNSNYKNDDAGVSFSNNSIDASAGRSEALPAEETAINESVALPDSNNNDTYEDTYSTIEEPVTESSESEQTETPTTTVAEANQKTKPVSDASLMPEESLSRQNPLLQQIQLTGKEFSDDNKMLSTYNVRLQNNSIQLLKLVAVDISYFNQKGVFLTRRTVYFNDVSPGASAALTVQGYKNATTVRSELGLVSSNGILYYVEQ